MRPDELEEIRRRAIAGRRGVDGVRPLRPGLPQMAMDDRDALLAEVDRLNEGRRQMRRRFHQVARYARTLRRDVGLMQDYINDLEELAHEYRALSDVETKRAAKAGLALLGVRTLLAEYEKDDRDHLDRFGQHHPVAGIAADHLRAALKEAE